MDTLEGDKWNHHIRIRDQSAARIYNTKMEATRSKGCPIKWTNIVKKKKTSQGLSNTIWLLGNKFLRQIRDIFQQATMFHSVAVNKWKKLLDSLPLVFPMVQHFSWPFSTFWWGQGVCASNHGLVCGVGEHWTNLQADPCDKNL